MDELAKAFSTMMTPSMFEELKLKAQQSLEQDQSTQTENIRVVAPDPATDSDTLMDASSLMKACREMVEHPPRPKYPPPARLPCANVQASNYQACQDPGTMACSSCKLVSYCSKACQIGHWKQHKHDCKNSLMSKDWKPGWAKESRAPSFITNENEIDDLVRQSKEEFSTGMSLWGNMPAVDVINLSRNENDAKKDFSLAFIASGDLRHVMRTFNALPEDYSGHLNILVNDINPFIFRRNLVLLLILGNVSDETMAADIALHFWYSVFVPAEYRFQISSILVSFLQQLRESNSFALGARSRLSTTLPTELLVGCLTHLISSSHSVADIQAEYNRVRSAPSRQDYRDRMYASLKPSHRVAFQEYRRFGIILPFGAVNAHFNCPNLSLFSPDGKWLQTDYADPLEGWDIPAVVNAGKAHGAHPEDIYGCLYFFLFDQLRSFSARLRKFSSSFTVLPMDARSLAICIREDGLPDISIPSKFDRIEVSNILDTNYVGLKDVLTVWGPFLEKSKFAAIVGYFMNWARLEKNAVGSRAGRQVMLGLLAKVTEKEKDIDPRQMEALILSSIGNMEAFYENSQTFLQFLQRQNLNGLLEKTGLALRKKHTIVPHRILAPLEGSPSSLPEFSDHDTWYYYTKLMSYTWSERYVEFEHNH